MERVVGWVEGWPGPGRGVDGWLGPGRAGRVDQGILIDGKRLKPKIQPA